jgi:hypothetical protein
VFNAFRFSGIGLVNIRNKGSCSAQVVVDCNGTTTLCNFCSYIIWHNGGTVVTVIQGNAPKQLQYRLDQQQDASPAYCSSVSENYNQPSFFCYAYGMKLVRFITIVYVSLLTYKYGYSLLINVVVDFQGAKNELVLGAAWVVMVVGGVYSAYLLIRYKPAVNVLMLLLSMSVVTEILLFRLATNSIYIMAVIVNYLPIPFPKPHSILFPGPLMALVFVLIARNMLQANHLGTED